MQILTLQKKCKQITRVKNKIDNINITSAIVLILGKNRTLARAISYKMKTHTGALDL